MAIATIIRNKIKKITIRRRLLRCGAGCSDLLAGGAVAACGSGPLFLESESGLSLGVIYFMLMLVCWVSWRRKSDAMSPKISTNPSFQAAISAAGVLDFIGIRRE